MLAVGSTLTLVFTVGSALAFMLTISGTLTFVLAVCSALALVLSVGGTCTFVLAVCSALALVLSVGGTCTFMLAVSSTLALVSRSSSSFRFAAGSGILATGRKFGTSSRVGLEVVGVIAQVAHLLTNLVGRSFLRIIRHRQLGSCLVIRIILHTFKEGNILFETIHAFLAILGGIGLDGHRGAGLGGRSSGFVLGICTQRKDGHKDH